MDKWILASEAAKIVGCHSEKIYTAATEGNWEFKTGKMPASGGKIPKLYLTKDVMALKKKRDSNKAKSGVKSSYVDAIKIVGWVDSLDEHPSIDEIEARTTDKYRVRDIMSVIENRTERGMPELQNAKGVLI